MKPSTITDAALATVGLMRKSQQHVVRFERDNLLSHNEVIQSLKMAPGHPIWEAVQSILTDAWIDAVGDASDGKLVGNPQTLAHAQGRVAALSEIKAVLAERLATAQAQKEEGR